MRNRRARPRQVEYTPGVRSPQSRALNDPAVAYSALRRAIGLAVIVRDEGADSVAAVLDPLDTQELYATIAVLAALVPDDVSPNELLAWLADDAAALERHADRDRHIRARTATTWQEGAA